MIPAVFDIDTKYAFQVLASGLDCMSVWPVVRHTIRLAVLVLALLNSRAGVMIAQSQFSM